VVRAIEIVERALEKFGAPVYVRHEIVHNQHVVDGLKAKGARFVDELDEVPEGAVTVFSAHGVPRAVVADARARGLPVLDATCPLVSKVHAQSRHYVRQGRELILIGHRGHPEVEGTVGQVSKPVHVVSTEAEVASLPIPPDRPVAYVTQTTLSVDETRGVIAALTARFDDVRGPDTSDICYATQHRQMAVRELCRTVEVLLVVGAKNSSNSNRLREIGEEEGVPSYLIADRRALDLDWVRGCKVVGLTAGASAPDDLVLDVIAALQEIDEVEVTEMNGMREDIVFRLPAELRDAPPHPASAGL